ncbi:MAG: hypothetical protein AAF437_01115 [Pseudomonadota bacterium]
MPIRTLWSAIIVLATIGIVSGLYMGMETLAPGIDGGIARKFRLYTFATHLHGVAMGLSLPVAAIGGLTCFLLADRKIADAAKLALNLCGYVMISLAFVALAFSEALQAFMASYDNLAVPAASAILVLLLLLRHPDRNASAVLFFGACLVPALFYVVATQGVFSSDADSIWADTHVATGLLHLIGLGLTLLFFACLSVWSYARGARLNLWITAAYVAGLLVIARFHIAAHISAGLAGMPRGYADYPQSFAPTMSVATWTGWLYTAVLIAGVVRFIYALWSRDRSSAADVF